MPVALGVSPKRRREGGGRSGLLPSRGHRQSAKTLSDEASLSDTGETGPVQMAHDSEDPNDGEQYHVAVGPGDVAERVLLPGNPERVDAISEVWDEATEQAYHREYRTATGEYRGTPVSVTSTGIGSPSAAIAVEELARVGVETFIRVGSTGANRPGVDKGDRVMTTGAVRQGGTSDENDRGE